MTGAAQQGERVFDAGPQRLHYLLALPPDYDQDLERRWPLILFLHGAGERGDDIALIRGYGIPRATDDGFEIPAVAVSPQCPAGERWSVPLLAALLDAIEVELRVDPDRIYLTGLSMGGFGAWALALAQPHRFAALVPVCGGGDARAVGVLRDLPVWAFHGARDDVVPLRRSEEMVEALQRAGGDVRFTVYPDAGHDSWTRAYADPELYRWLFAQHRRSQ